jgi:excisionase family DNA binding protein
MKSPVFTASEVARLLRCSRNNVYVQAAAGNLPVVYVGRLVRFPRDRILAILDGRVQPLAEVSIGEDAR